MILYSEDCLWERQSVKSIGYEEPRVPVAPPGYAHQSEKDYDRKKMKKETKKAAESND
jgi:hypothetical protein